MKKILISSNEPWGKVWFCKQHYAYELSKLGYEVLFINPVTSWKPRNLFSFSLKVEKENEFLTLVTYQNNFPVRIFPKVFTYLNDQLNVFKIRKKFPSNSYVSWQFDPFRFVYLNKKIFKRIYHVADPYIHFPFDKLIANRSNLIVCTSQKYLPFYKGKSGRVIFIPHGISLEERLVDKEQIEKLKHSLGEYILLVGTLNDTVDFSLFTSIADLGYHLVLIGSLNIKSEANKAKLDKILKHRNITFLGPKHAKTLKNYIRGAKLCITAYQFDLKKSVGTGTPLKILNYLTQYKPVITSIDSEIPTLEGKGIFTAKNWEEYKNFIELGMNGQLPINREDIDHYLSNHEYPNLIESILQHLEMEA